MDILNSLAYIFKHFNLFFLQCPGSWLWLDLDKKGFLDLETPEGKRNYGPKQIPNIGPNVPWEIFP